MSPGEAAAKRAADALRLRKRNGEEAKLLLEKCPGIMGILRRAADPTNPQEFFPVPGAERLSVCAAHHSFVRWLEAAARYEDPE